MELKSNYAGSILTAGGAIGLIGFIVIAVDIGFGDAFDGSGRTLLIAGIIGMISGMFELRGMRADSRSPVIMRMLVFLFGMLMVIIVVFDALEVRDMGVATWFSLVIGILFINALALIWLRPSDERR